MMASKHRDLEVWRDGVRAPDAVAEEVPLSLVINGQPHVVMMGSPQDLEDFARGFCVTEGVVESVDEIEDLHVVEVEGGLQLRLRLPPQRAAALSPRNLQGRTGCGVCGARDIDAVMRPLRRVPAGTRLRPAAIRRALEALPRHQPANALTGAVHAAAWVSPDGLIDCVREDVGRHNALDKLIGHLLQGKRDLAQGFCLISSRASYEMVQKAVNVGMPTLVAISAPTALAVRMAESAGLTLIGFARTSRHVIYSCPSRLEPEGPAP